MDSHDKINIQDFYIGIRQVDKMMKHVAILCQIILHAIYHWVDFFHKQFIYLLRGQTGVEIRFDENTSVVIEFTNDGCDWPCFFFIMLDIDRHTFAFAHHPIPFEDNPFIQVRNLFSIIGNLVRIQPIDIFLFFG